MNNDETWFYISYSAFFGIHVEIHLDTCIQIYIEIHLDTCIGIYIEIHLDTCV